MGSALLSVAEAANRLNRSKRQVQNYLKDGLLSKHRQQNGEVRVSREEVDQLAIDLGNGMPTLNRKTFYALVAQVRKLEESMAVVRRIHEIRDNPLRPSKLEAASLYKFASVSLAQAKWSQEEVQTWANLFDRMDELTFDAVAEAMADHRPWVPFYNLCLSMMRFVYAQGEYRTNLPWQQLHQQLDQGRKKLRTSVLLWTEAGRGTLPQNVLKEVDSSMDDLMSRLTGKNR